MHLSSECVDPAVAAEIRYAFQILMEEHGPWSRLVFAKPSFGEQGCQIWLWKGRQPRRKDTIDASAVLKRENYREYGAEVQSREVSDIMTEC